MKTISSQATDAELNSAIAEEILGWGKSLTKEYTDRSLWCDRHWAKSADAVLPLLIKTFAVFSYHTDRNQFCADVHPRLTSPFIEAFGPFERAACFCLLKAHGWTVSP